MLYCDYFQTQCGHVTGIHNEMISTINLQIEGTKKWTLIDPKFSDYLIPFFPKKNTQYCSMNFGWKKLPSDLKIPHYEVLVEKGDLLFVPSWWWHQPISITDSKHIGLRTVHNTTFYSNLFMPKQISKLAFLLPLVYKRKPSSNTDLNKGLDILDYYVNNDIKFIN